MPTLRLIGAAVCAVLGVVCLYYTIHYFNEGLPSFLFNFGGMALFSFGAVVLWRGERS